MVTTQPSLGAGAALLTALSVANIVMLVSPVVIVVLAVLQVIPASLRARVSASLGWGAGANAASASIVADFEAYKSSSEPEPDAYGGTDAGALGAAVDGSAATRPYGEHDDLSLHPVKGTWAGDEESVTSSSGAMVQVEMVELAKTDAHMGIAIAASTVQERIDLPAPERKAMEADAGAVDDDITRTNVRSWLLARGASTDATTISVVQRLMEQHAVEAERQNNRIDQLLRQVTVRQQESMITQRVHESGSVGANLSQQATSLATAHNMSHD
jgi:hypothetical protein